MYQIAVLLYEKNRGVHANFSKATTDFLKLIWFHFDSWWATINLPEVCHEFIQVENPLMQTSGRLIKIIMPIPRGLAYNVKLYSKILDANPGGFGRIAALPALSQRSCFHAFQKDFFSWRHPQMSRRWLSQKVGPYRLEITKMSSFMFSLSSLRCRGDWRRALARVALTTNFQ